MNFGLIPLFTRESVRGTRRERPERAKTTSSSSDSSEVAPTLVPYVRVADPSGCPTFPSLTRPFHIVKLERLPISPTFPLDAREVTPILCP